MGNMKDNSVEGITVVQLNLVYHKPTWNNGIILVAAETVLVLQGTHFLRVSEELPCRQTWTTDTNLERAVEYSRLCDS